MVRVVLHHMQPRQTIIATLAHVRFPLPHTDVPSTVTCHMISISRDSAAPFRTVARAQAAVRAHRAAAKDGSQVVSAVRERATVQISGLCELDATLQLDDPTLGE